MSVNILEDALPILGETEKASSDLTKSTNGILAQKFDKFDLKSRISIKKPSKHEVSRFHKKERKALKEKYFKLLDVQKIDTTIIEAMFNGMYNLAKRHSFDIKEAL